MDIYFKQSFVTKIVNVPVQPNGFDYGMYIIKYIEAGNSVDCTKISFTVILVKFIL